MKPTSEQIEQVRELLKNKKVYEIQAITGISWHHINRIATGKIKEPVKDAEIIEAAKTMSYRQMVEKFRCSPTRIANLLANRSDSEFERFKPMPEEPNAFFSLETMGEPF